MLNNEDLKLLKENYSFYKSNLKKLKEEYKEAYDFEKLEIERFIRLTEKSLEETKEYLKASKKIA